MLRETVSMRKLIFQLDVDVEVSGSDSGDESPEAEEDESDRIFAGSEFAPTQAPRGYNQRAMYMAGLSTQAGRHAGLGFRQRGDKEGFLAKARKPVLVTDSEGSEGESDNEYQLGSFVVQDDDDLGFDACKSDQLLLPDVQDEVLTTVAEGDSLSYS